MLVWMLTCLLIPAGDDTNRWPRLFGPTGDSVVPTQELDLSWPERGPRELWSMELGESYTTPSIEGKSLVLFHRIGDEEMVDCLDVETRRRRWRFAYPTEYVDQYGYNNGPRSTPIISGGVVYTLGAEGKMHALDLETGRKIWSRWLNREFNVRQDFFGVGGSPLLDDGKLIINVGGSESEAGVVALRARDGETEWQRTSDGPSYATPAVGLIHGRRVAFVFTKAGLAVIDSGAGELLRSLPFRSRLYESVNASSPVVVGDVCLVSATYGTGSLCVRVQKDGSVEELWRSTLSMDSHFSNLMEKDGYVYGFAGRHEPDAELRCIELETGKIRWSMPTALGRGSMVRHGEDWILWGERGRLMTARLGPDQAPELPEEVPSLLRYPCWTPPAIVSGRLYLRNETKLICLDLRPAAGTGR